MRNAYLSCFVIRKLIEGRNDFGFGAFVQHRERD